MHKLNPKKRYLQIALNSTLSEAYQIISQLPRSDRILIEAGTPLIKRYGEEGIRKIAGWWRQKLINGSIETPRQTSSHDFIYPWIVKLFLDYRREKLRKEKIPLQTNETNAIPIPYVVADLKMMDRGTTEVEIAASAGASAATALGCSPIESLNTFIEACEQTGLDAMIDMMNVEFPLTVLRSLKKLPSVVILHRGVDEEQFNKQKQIPLHEIQRIKGNYNIMISIAGGDTIREVQRSLFNDADIVVVWKSFYKSSSDTALLAQEFLKEIK